MGTVIITLALVGLIIWIIAVLRRDKKQGKACSGCCAGCCAHCLSCAGKSGDR